MVDDWTSHVGKRGRGVVGYIYPMRMAPLFRIMDGGSSGMEKVALIWRMKALLLSLW